MVGFAEKIAISLYEELSPIDEIDETTVEKIIEQKRKYSQTCHSILIALMLILLAITLHLTSGLDKSSIGPLDIALGADTVFLGFVIGNFLFIIQLAAFLRVVVYEKVLRELFNSKSFKLDRKSLIFNSVHFTYIIKASIEEIIERKPRFLERAFFIYQRFFIIALYTILYFTILAVYLYDLFLNYISFDVQHYITNPQDIRYPVYIFVLVSINLISSCASAYFLRPLGRDRLTPPKTGKP